MEGNSFLSDIVPFYVTDIDGCTMKLSKVADTNYLIPHFPASLDIMKDFPNIEAYPDDVIICGFPKCGTHWIWEIANMLILGSSEYVETLKESAMIEAMPSMDELKRMSRPRVLNSHLPPKLLPPEFLKKASKLVYLVRHPKDVAVSLFNHVHNQLKMYEYEGTWSAFLDLFINGKVEYGSYVVYAKEWETFMEDHPVHVLHYEDMKKDPVTGIKGLAKFLDRDIEDHIILEIAEKTSFTRMKVAKAAFDDEEEKAFWNDGIPLMYRKGEIDDWKNWFTVSQAEVFDAIFEREMKDSRIIYPT